MNQPSLFNQPPGPVDPNVDDRDKPRLSKQCAMILEALRHAEQTNWELMMIATRYGARIHDLRRAGYDIRVQLRGGGTFVYSLD